MFPWSALELIDGLSATPDVWQELMGTSLPAFRSLYLKPNPNIGGLLPCPRQCGCFHRIIPRHDHAGAIAICRCLPATCPDIPLTLEQATPLVVDVPKLGRNIARAFGCRPAQATIGALHTQQIGAWSSDGVPVFLSIQTNRRDLHHAATHLAAILREEFILLTPTKKLVTADTSQILAAVRASIFDLASNLAVTPNGMLHPVRTPGELFIQFNPDVKDIDQSVAERAFALITQLDSELNLKPPSAITVFRLYCIEELSANQIASKCHCSKATVLNRLASIHSKTGTDPKSFRRISSHIATIQQNLSDSRAKSIHRTTLADDLDPEED